MQNLGMDCGRPPLRWMVLEARAFGLRTKPFEHELTRHEQINVSEFLSPSWWLLELWYFHRLTYTRRNDGKKMTHW